jgi:hypothetical protein
MRPKNIYLKFEADTLSILLHQNFNLKSGRGRRARRTDLYIMTLCSSPENDYQIYWHLFFVFQV